MNSHYWYFKVEPGSSIVSVYKKNGLFGKTYDFGSSIRSITKRKIKYILKDAPSDCRYTFVYNEDKRHSDDIFCVNIMHHSVFNGVDLFENVKASDFFKLVSHFEIRIPDVYSGVMVFNTFKENIDKGILVKSGNFYEVTTDNVLVYPLSAK